MFNLAVGAGADNPANDRVSGPNGSRWSVIASSNSLALVTFAHSGNAQLADMGSGAYPFLNVAEFRGITRDDAIAPTADP